LDSIDNLAVVVVVRQSKKKLLHFDCREGLKMRRTDFDKVRTLGRGGFGEALLVRERKEKNVYVLKKVSISNSRRAGIRRTLRVAIEEAQILKRLIHPNIIRYVDHFIEFEKYDDINLYLVMEYARCGDLRKFIRTRKSHLNDRVVLIFLMQLSVAISYCHRRKIMHRDLKPENIFISSAGILKLGDFGLAREISEDAMARTRCGTADYIAPEVLQDRPYSFSCDMWSLGCITHELLMLQHPFRDRTPLATVQRVLRGKPRTVSTKNKSLALIVKQLLERNPRKRLSSKNLLARPLIQRAVRAFVKRYGAFPQEKEEEEKTTTKAIDTTNSRTIPLNSPPPVFDDHEIKLLKKNIDKKRNVGEIRRRRNNAMMTRKRAAWRF